MTLTLPRRKRAPHYNGLPVYVAKKHYGADTTWYTVEIANGHRIDVPSYRIDWKAS